jgi:hypothetical protein
MSVVKNIVLMKNWLNQSLRINRYNLPMIH